jgi:hypothetical protein
LCNANESLRPELQSMVGEIGGLRRGCGLEELQKRDETVQHFSKLQPKRVRRSHSCNRKSFPGQPCAGGGGEPRSGAGGNSCRRKAPFRRFASLAPPPTAHSRGGGKLRSRLDVRAVYSVECASSRSDSAPARSPFDPEQIKFVMARDPPSLLRSFGGVAHSPPEALAKAGCWPPRSRLPGSRNS